MITDKRKALAMTRQARLSDIEPRREKIGDMQIGSSGWAVPWSMSADLEGFCWLRPDYEVHSSAGGTVQMLVRRDDEGFHVVVPTDVRDDIWKRRSGGMHYSIPVVTLTGDERTSRRIDREMKNRH